MNLDNVLCGDIEGDGLLDTISKIHVASFGYPTGGGQWSVFSTSNYATIEKIFSDPTKTIVIHNGKRFDVPAIEKILGITVKATIIDSLSLAWYVDCKRGGSDFNLKSYGESFGIKKVEIEDWVGLTYEEYKERCEFDIQIQIKLWEYLLDKLRRIYDTDEDIVRIIKYLNFIMECSRYQEEQKILIDIEKVKQNLAYFEGLKEAKVVQLKEAMPKRPIIRTVTKPAVMYKKDGSLSVAGKKWLDLNPGTFESVEVITGYEEPNPNSVPQKKDWLYSLGWKPITFDYKRDKKTGEVKKIPQILNQEKELCKSVLKLVDIEPAIEILDGISVLTHRIGILNGLLENQKDGYVVQGLERLAVTLRWQHSVVVNFPKVTGKKDIRDGEWIRECLIAGDGYKLVQSDLSGIESRTSDHYTFPLNPDRIAHTQQKYFDPHTEVAVVSNLMTKDEEIWFKAKKEGVPVSEIGSLSSNFLVEDEGKLMNKLKGARHKAKTTNYASLYQVGPDRLSHTLDISKREAKALIDAYWKIHWAVKKVTESFSIKKVGDELWVLNPVSKFRHHLRNEKDAFSTVNQSTAVYCFNMWLHNITKHGYWPILQTHDDLCLRVKKEDVKSAKAVIGMSMVSLNKQLKLNVPLACEVQVGDKLSETH